MRFYPQLSSGAVAQFPFRAAHRRRTIVNDLPDGRVVHFEDWGAQKASWRLEYADLSLVEWEALRSLHEEMSGRLGTFTFFDPNSNLLAWSEEFERAPWVRDAFLNVASGMPDPLGGTSGRLLTNTSGVDQRLAQRLGIPGTYFSAFSIWLRSDVPRTVQLVGQQGHKEIQIGETWHRAEFAGPGSGSSEGTDFGIVIPSGATIVVFGAQAEAQPTASSYKRNEGAGGIYSKARFSSDTIECWSDGPGRYRTVVTLESMLEAA